MALDLSCAFATSMQSHEHARIVEDLGCKCAWLQFARALSGRLGATLSRRGAHATHRPGGCIPTCIAYEFESFGQPCSRWLL